MFGQKNTGGVAPTGLTMMLKSLGLDPQDFMVQINALIGRGNQYAESFDTRLANLESSAQKNAEALARVAATLERIESWMDVQTLAKAMQENMGASGGDEFGPRPEREDIDIWPMQPQS